MKYYTLTSANAFFAKYMFHILFCITLTVLFEVLYFMILQNKLFALSCTSVIKLFCDFTFSTQRFLCTISKYMGMDNQDMIGRLLLQKKLHVAVVYIRAYAKKKKCTLN